MPSRAVERLITPKQQLEGGGFLVRKAIGSSALPHIDPFIMLDHIGPVTHKPGEAVGAPDHPHRGFEVVSYIIDGGVEHKDSAGNQGILGPGWVQWMTAGCGVVHSEMPPKSMLENGGTMEGFQLWVNLPKIYKMTEPRYQDVASEKIPVVKSDDGKVTIKVIAGSALGSNAVIQTKTKIMFLDIRMQAGSQFVQAIPSSYQGFTYCWRGSGKIGSADLSVNMGQVGVISQSEHGDSFSMKASQSEECRLLLICGEPIKEPIVHYGPFVMNTQEEINQAINDYQSGKLGTIPGAEERISQTEKARSLKTKNGSS